MASDVEPGRVPAKVARQGNRFPLLPSSAAWRFMAALTASNALGGPPIRLQRKGPAKFPARPVNASAAKWRVLANTKSPASFALTGHPQLRDWR
jgi:hypothetical protein